MKLAQIAMSLGPLILAGELPAQSNGPKTTQVFREGAELVTRADTLEPGTMVTIPRYDDNGNKIGERSVTAEEAWKDINRWESDVVKKYQQNSAGESISTVTKWDPDVSENVERVGVPQDPEQKRLLDQQKSRVDQPSVTIAPQSLSAELNKDAGNNKTFGAFQRGRFKADGAQTEVKTENTFSAGGSVFGNRFTLVSQETRIQSNKNSKTTTTNIKVLDQSVFVSRDGTVNANKTFTRSIRKSKTFFVGLPISVGGSVSGSMGANLNYKTEFLNVSGSVTPFLNAGGTVDAGLDLFFVKAGVEGALTFIENTVQADFNAGQDARGNLVGGLKVTNRQEVLKGSVSVFARIRRVLRGFKTFSKTLFSFSGIVQNETILDRKFSTASP